MHVLKDIPIFEDLIERKWNKFGLRHHLLYTILPYFIFFCCFTAGATPSTLYPRPYFLHPCKASQ